MANDVEILSAEEIDALLSAVTSSSNDYVKVVQRSTVMDYLSLCIQDIVRLSAAEIKDQEYIDNSHRDIVNKILYVMTIIKNHASFADEHSMKEHEG